MILNPHGSALTAVKCWALLPLLISLCSCQDDPNFPDGSGVLGGVEKPDISWALGDASDPKNEGHIGQLTYERCRKLAPLVKPIHQLWHCEFGVKRNEVVQDCSVVMSVQPDDHFGVWRPEWRLDPKTGEGVSTLVCNVQPPTKSSRLDR